MTVEEKKARTWTRQPMFSLPPNIAKKVSLICRDEAKTLIQKYLDHSNREDFEAANELIRLADNIESRMPISKNSIPVSAPIQAEPVKKTRGPYKKTKK